MSQEKSLHVSGCFKLGRSLETSVVLVCQERNDVRANVCFQKCNSWRWVYSMCGWNQEFSVLKQLMYFLHWRKLCARHSVYHLKACVADAHHVVMYFLFEINFYICAKMLRVRPVFETNAGSFSMCWGKNITPVASLWFPLQSLFHAITPKTKNKVYMQTSIKYSLLVSGCTTGIQTLSSSKWLMGWF